nr:uncharacterized protein LOC113804678 [Penaeus vannamei]
MASSCLAEVPVAFCRQRPEGEGRTDSGFLQITPRASRFLRRILGGGGLKYRRRNDQKGIRRGRPRRRTRSLGEDFEGFAKRIRRGRGIPVDNQNFVHLVACTQLMSRELRKCKRLVQTMPVDMTEYYENKPGPSGMGGLGVISQLLLCKTLQPDFQQEEVCSIEKDSDDINAILKEMQDYMPQEDAANRNLALTGEDMFSLWSKKRTRRSLYRNMSALCCTCKPAYL